MLITIIRTVILYIFVVIAVRLMGKRQLSDLQPSELVVTLLIADIASIPMENTDTPMLSGIIPTLILVACEITVSVIMMKNSRFRNAVCGVPVVVIENGEILRKQMRKLRMTTEDLCIQLRQQGVFSIGDVDYCIVETNGRLSVLVKPEKQNPTAEDMNIEIADTGIDAVVINDGEYHEASMRLSNTNKKELNNILKKNNTKLKDVFIMTYNKNGEYNIIKKD
ncbi:MAG: DUF421 domain-containing protein [Ruminococcus sp.]|nr:DUF421 domain-containing protein [Ruminococcus sp.]